MRWFRQVRGWLRRRRLDEEMRAEMQAHLEMDAARRQAAGLDAGDARAAAERDFGNLASLQERVRAQRGWLWLEQAGADARHAVRLLRKGPGFAAVVVFTLALGIGLSTVAFSFYVAIALKPLEVRAPDEIVRLSADARDLQAPFTAAEFSALQAGLKSVRSVVAVSPLQAVLAAREGSPRQEPASAQLVSGNFFSALGVPPVLGRDFLPGETAVAVLSHAAWQRRYGRDPGVVGRVVRIQDVAVTIVGVAPERFGGVGAPPAVPDFWLPMELQPEVLPKVQWLHESPVRTWALLARRERNFAPQQVAAEIGVLAQDWPQPDRQRLHPGARPATFFELHGPAVHAVGVTLVLAVSLILLVGGVNVINLVAARNATREHELAVRLALGASRGRLVRQLCTETMLLGLLGGAFGLLFAWWACAALQAAAMSVMREMSRGLWSFFLDLAPDGRVFSYAVGLSLLAGLAVGLRPARRALRADVEAVLKQNAPGHSGGGPRSRRNWLLAGQVGASLLLLAGAGLLLRGAAHALATDPGFDASRLLGVAAWNNLQSAPLPEAEQVRRARLIADRLRAVPEIAAVAGADRLPFSGHAISPYETDEGRRLANGVALRVDENYFEALQLPIVAGRNFMAAEVTGSRPVVIISESAARHLWPGHDPLGRTVAAVTGPHGGDLGPRLTVIGVARDARFTLLSRTDDADLFFPAPATALWLVRTRGAPEAAAPSILAALRGIDPALAASTDVMTMEEGPMKLQRLAAQVPAMLAVLLAAIALTLSAVGTYGVVSFLVARRTREIGVRLALGARPRDVVWLVLAQTLRPIGWGAAFGSLGAIGFGVLVTRLVLNPELPDLTYGAGVFSPIMFAGVLGVMSAVILVAAFLPARRAARVDPMNALRAE